MEIETLFTATKWDIIQSLSEGKKSPQQLSIECRTSIANISQQLRLLELAGFVNVERIPNRDKGQPRILYSLKGNNAFLIACTPGFAEKKQVVLSPSQKATLTIWLSVDSARQYFVEKAFWDLQDNIKDIDVVYYDKHSLSSISLIILSDKANIAKNLSTYSIEKDGLKLPLKISVTKKSDFKKTSSLIKLYEDDNKK